jgi:hypothetical protein
VTSIPEGSVPPLFFCLPRPVSRRTLEHPRRSLSGVAGRQHKIDEHLDIVEDRRRNSRMAKHEISLEIPHGIKVINRDIQVDVRENNELLGRILISKGSIAWRRGNAQRVKHLRWSRFAEIMEIDGTERRRRS